MTTTPRGIRNCNPLNIRRSAAKWKSVKSSLSGRRLSRTTPQPISRECRSSLVSAPTSPSASPAIAPPVG